MEANQILYSDDRKETVELININKFTLLYMLSLGLYGIWWMYKIWKFFKEKNRLDIMPAARAIFAIFFAYELFERILKYAKKLGYSKGYSSMGLFALFIILNFMGRLPDPYWLVSFLALFGLIPPLNAFNYAVEKSEEYNGVYKEGLNARQMILVVIGGLFWVLMIMGLMESVGQY